MSLHAGSRSSDDVEGSVPAAGEKSRPVLVVTTGEGILQPVRHTLAAHGWAVKSCSDGTAAIELATSESVAGIVAGAVLPDMSGVQLFRLLDQDSRFGDVPLVLVAGVDDAKTRLYAGATCPRAHVVESPESELPALLSRFERASLAPPPERRDALVITKDLLMRRLSQALDEAAFEAVVAAEVRALAAFDGYEQLFAALEGLLRRLLRPGWIALLVDGTPPVVFLSAPHGRRAESDAAARAALGAGPEVRTVASRGGRATAPPSGEGWLAAEVPVFSGNKQCAQLAVALPRSAHTHSDRRLLDLVAAELGGPFRIVALLEEARRSAATDLLTGLMNRRAMLEQVGREARRAQRYGHALAVLLVDIDLFKDVNDAHGHFAGDKVIQTVASVAKRVLRQSDYIARWGGEEFLVALPCTDVAGAAATAERLRRAVEGATTVVDETSLRVTVSVGVAHASAPWIFDELARAADAALYEAKAAGRNRVAIASGPVPASRSRERPAVVAGSGTLER